MNVHNHWLQGWDLTLIGMYEIRMNVTDQKIVLFFPILTGQEKTLYIFVHEVGGPYVNKRIAPNKTNAFAKHFSAPSVYKQTGLTKSLLNANVERRYAIPASFVPAMYATRRRNALRQTALLPTKTHVYVTVNNVIKIIVMKQKPIPVSI